MFFHFLLINLCINLCKNTDGVMHAVGVKKTNTAPHRRCGVTPLKLTPTVTPHRYTVGVTAPPGHPNVDVLNKWLYLNFDTFRHLLNSYLKNIHVFHFFINQHRIIKLFRRFSLRCNRSDKHHRWTKKLFGRRASIKNLNCSRKSIRNLPESDKKNHLIGQFQNLSFRVNYLANQSFHQLQFERSPEIAMIFLMMALEKIVIAKNLFWVWHHLKTKKLVICVFISFHHFWWSILRFRFQCDNRRLFWFNQRWLLKRYFWWLAIPSVFYLWNRLMRVHSQHQEMPTFFLNWNTMRLQQIYWKTVIMITN